MAAPEAWNEMALISISDGTTSFTIHAITDSIDINQGGKPMESIPTLSGGRVLKLTPEEDTEITFEGYPIAIGDKDATSQDGLDLFFHGGTDSAPAFSVSSSTTRNVFKITIMWTDSTATAATSSVPSGNYALRYNFANCYMTACKPKMTTTEPVKATWTFKCAPRNKAGTSNITVESVDGTISMATI